MLLASTSVDSFGGWHFHPDVWVLMLSLLGGYYLALRVLGPTRAEEGSPAASTKQKLCFVLGVAILWVGSDWPIHELSEDFLFSVHMTQHTLFSLVAPALILMGMPAWLLRAMLPGRLMKMTRWVTRPFVALLLFNGVVIVTHWPVVVDASLRSEPLHFLVHLVLVFSSLVMWWPVVDPLPETKRLSEPAKMLYLFMQSILPTVPASFLTFATEPMYSFYESVPRLWGIDVVSDQRVAGLIMKIVGGLLLWTAIAYVFFRWSASENETPDTEITWEDFERELQAWDLRKQT